MFCRIAEIKLCGWGCGVGVGFRMSLFSFVGRAFTFLGLLFIVILMGFVFFHFSLRNGKHGHMIVVLGGGGGGKLIKALK